MNTLALSNRRPIYKATGHNIGANTQNVTFNVPDKAAEIMDAVFKPNRSERIRFAIAREIQRLDTWSGLAFRAACKIGNEVRSIFTNLPHAERKPIFDASVEELEAEKSSAHPNGDKVTDDCVNEFRPEGQFLKAKGVK